MEQMGDARDREAAGLMLRSLAQALLPEEAFPSVPVDFTVGSAVRCVGLHSTVDLNGVEGTVVRLATPRRNRIHVSVARPLRTLAFRPRNLVPSRQTPREGATVLLHSLQQRKDLNGEAAHVLAQSANPVAACGPRRVQVRTNAGDCISVPLACTLVLPLVAAERQPPPQQATCCVCLQDSRPITAADPCGHVCVCEGCSRQFARGAPCPLCRQPVSKYITLFSASS